MNTPKLITALKRIHAKNTKGEANSVQIPSNAMPKDKGQIETSTGLRVEQGTRTLVVS
jgi:hypothetical protein